MNTIERRIIELSYAHKLSHISSCLNCVNLIDSIYARMQPGDIFVCGNGHASLAHFVVLESLGKCDAEMMIEHHGVHSSRDVEHGIHVSNGSLGQAESISTGFALADLNRTVWLVTSDGSMMEGASSEAMRIARKYCPNLKVFIVFNALGAYGKIDLKDLPKLPDSAEIIYVDQTRYPEWMRGLAGHYLVLDSEQYKEVMI